MGFVPVVFAGCSGGREIAQRGFAASQRQVLPSQPVVKFDGRPIAAVPRPLRHSQVIGDRVVILIFHNQTIAAQGGEVIVLRSVNPASGCRANVNVCLGCRRLQFRLCWNLAGL